MPMNLAMSENVSELLGFGLTAITDKAFVPFVMIESLLLTRHE